MNQHEHHDKADELATDALALLQSGLTATELEAAGHAELAVQERLVAMSEALAAVAQVHATLATVSV